MSEVETRGTVAGTVVLIIVGAVAAVLGRGCKPAEAPSREADYRAELVACVEQSESALEYEACAAQVDKRYCGGPCR